MQLNFSILHSDINFKSFLPYYGLEKVDVLIKKMGLEFGELAILERDTIKINFNPLNGFMIKKKHYGSFSETTYEYNNSKLISKTIDFRNNEELHRTKIELLDDRIRTHISFKSSSFSGMSMNDKYLFDLSGKVIKKSTQLNNFDETVTDYKYDKNNFIIEQWGKTLGPIVKEQDFINEKSDSILIVHNIKEGILNELIFFDNYLLKVNKYNHRKMQLIEAIECSYNLNNGKVVNVKKLDKHSILIKKLSDSIKIKTNEKLNVQSLDKSIIDSETPRMTDFEMLKIESVAKLDDKVYVIINGKRYEEGDRIDRYIIEDIYDDRVVFLLGDTRVLKGVGK